MADNVLRTPFNASWFDREALGNQARDIARDMGFEHKDDIDAFRHAYIWSKLRDASSEGFARFIGELNEDLGGNREAEWKADILNNEEGMKIGARADRFVEEERQKKADMSKEEELELKERYIRVNVAHGVRNGDLIPNPKNNTFRHDEALVRYRTYEDKQPLSDIVQGDPQVGPGLFTPLYSRFRKW